MNEIERKEHLKKLNNERVKKHYRKKKMEQLKKNSTPKITIQKVNLDDDDIRDEELLIYLYENVKFDNSKDDKEVVESINILEDQLGLKDKLNTFDSDSDSDIDSEIDSDSDY